ncbi:flagella assembly protein FlgT middle domain-containing protein [Marinobacter changyiensis]|uniref:flagella assembly protein FlgT middle domain-containing protein n=1 Tax=Marinobacter changyiensis TaxID=2604091 RepID=UPI0015D33846|nr:flagella assembly protein FlgT middle domain-containing protein [Marinobacter changyiensis]
MSTNTDQKPSALVVNEQYQEIQDDELTPSAESMEIVGGALNEPVHLIITKQVGGTQDKLDVLAESISSEQLRPEFVPGQQCPDDRAPRYRKKLAVAGFTLEHAGQSVFGGLGQVGKAVSGMLYQNFRETGSVQPFAAPDRQMFASLGSAPTHAGFGNRLSKYSAVSREMGVQFVVSGVVRNVDVHNPDAWNTSTYAKMKRSLFSADKARDFVVDVVVHDGYTGQVVMEERYATSGRWDVSRTDRVGIDSERFGETGYGQAVSDLLEEISGDITRRLECQPMLVPILEVTGKDLVLDVGTDSGLLPGVKMNVVRAQSSWANPDAPPRLVDTGVKLHIHSLSLDRSIAWMPEHGGALNIQLGDYAVIY